MKVIVAGAGIGGLTAALSLHQAGIEVTVYEAVDKIRPLGVGINILPNASRELIEMGLGGELDRLAIRTSAMNYYTRDGRLVISQPCGLHAGYRWPQWSMHRGELQMALLGAFQRSAGQGRLVTDAALVDFVEDKRGKVTARFEHGRAGGSSDAQCDVLVGADGLHSATRARLYPDEGKPVYCGMVLYRAAVQVPQYLDGRTMVIIGDKRLRLVAYPLSGSLLKQGNGVSLVNWIGALSMDRDQAPPENWTRLSRQDRLLPRYARWRFDWLDVPAVIGASREIFEYPVYDRDPLERWTTGSVTLLGDAAHPLIPVSSNGAGQAILDARALAYALATHDDSRAGLRAYQADRLEQANRVVRSSRNNGPDEVLEIARRRCPEGAANIHDYVSLQELQAVIDEFKESAGFGVETLNARPSYQVPRSS